MNKFYFALQSTSDLFSKYNDDDIDPAVPAHSLSIPNATISIVHDTEESYPDLVIETESEDAPTAVIEGVAVIAEAIAGSHPPYRPK